MADDQDKSQQTEEPTAKRLEQARQHGDMVKSQEVNAFVLLAGGTLAIAVFGKYTAVGLARTLTIFLEQPDAISVDGPGLAVMTRMLLSHLAVALGPFFGVMMLAALAGHLVQGMPVFSAEKLVPDLTKLSPLSGFKRLFGADGWMNLAKGLMKMAIVGIAIWMQLWPERNAMGNVLTQSAGDVVGDMTHLLFKVLMTALAALAVIAGLDYFWQRMQFLKRNRMSKQEIKEEYRQNEGDPAIKAKIRQIRQERSRKRMMAKVPGATVVIMNPTHYAVALQYESGNMAAPVCVAKGVDALALRIRAVAEENDVPVVENPPLARALYAAIDIDEPVPPEHFKAVAQVIGYVFRLQGKIPRN
ncbi:MAG: flagellar biosynthesis protein FlhB [Alphaproteobacteria bacterium 64-11]|nr:flagellar biosynthesis protein FlhB [Alphaproteobacteria bacterium]OJU12856.1 MAG: flagellar biosynthesis protein FlhB [Alphaproteobacteria bacterium 64-11]